MSTIVVDLETCPHPLASEFVLAPDLDAITASKNLKDPVKIEADLAKRKADAQSEFETSLSRAALDFNLNRIVAIGWAMDGALTVRTCKDETEEALVLTEFWRVSKRQRIAGFCARTFDVPTLIQRSRYLSVPHPDVNLARYGRGDVLDLRDVLTFDDARYEAIMPRSLKMFCKRFGIPVNDEIAGADVPRLVAEDNWDGVVAHVTSDVGLTVALAERLGYVRVAEAVL